LVTVKAVEKAIPDRVKKNMEIDKILPKRGTQAYTMSNSLFVN